MSARVDGEVPIPPEKWYHILDRLTRIDELLELLVRQIDLTNNLLRKLTGVAAPPIVTPPPPTAPPEEKPMVVRFPYNNTYKIFWIDLRVRRVNEPIGLRELRIVPTSLSILRADAPAYIRLNSERYDPIEVKVGLTIENFEIDEVFVTNEAQPSEAYVVMWLEWRT